MVTQPTGTALFHSSLFYFYFCQQNVCEYACWKIMLTTNYFMGDCHIYISIKAIIGSNYQDLSTLTDYRLFQLGETLTRLISIGSQPIKVVLLLWLLIVAVIAKLSLSLNSRAESYKSYSDQPPGEVYCRLNLGLIGKLT